LDGLHADEVIEPEGIVCRRHKRRKKMNLQYLARPFEVHESKQAIR
jgi:hypothetical protein